MISRYVSENDLTTLISYKTISLTYSIYSSSIAYLAYSPLDHNGSLRLLLYALRHTILPQQWHPLPNSTQILLYGVILSASLRHCLRSTLLLPHPGASGSSSPSLPHAPYAENWRWRRSELFSEQNKGRTPKERNRWRWKWAPPGEGSPRAKITPPKLVGCGGLEIGY